MAKIQQKSYLYIYADSHGSDRHYFREQFEPLFERSKRFKKPKIKANPGCEMNQKKCWIFRSSSNLRSRLTSK